MVDQHIENISPAKARSFEDVVKSCEGPSTMSQGTNIDDGKGLELGEVLIYVCWRGLQIAALTDRNHAYMVMDQLNKRGGRAILAPLSAPPVEPEGKHSSTLVRGPVVDKPTI